MNKGIIRTLYYKDIWDTDYEIAHLFEHITIHNFKRILRQMEYIDGIWGWLSGDTFTKTMFLDAGFYDKDAFMKYVNFIEQPQVITEEIVRHEIRRMEAEDDVIISYNTTEVMRRLNELNHRSYKSISGKSDIFFHCEKEPLKKNPKSEHLIAKRSKKDFQNFSVKIGIENPTDIEKAIFLRLNVIASDVVGEVLNSLTAYGHHFDGPLFNEKVADVIFEYLELCIKKTQYNEKTIKDKIMYRLKEVDFSDNKEELKSFIRGYYKDSADDFPIEYYRSTGILTSKYHVYKLFTPKNVQAAWDKLEIKVEKL